MIEQIVRPFETPTPLAGDVVTTQQTLVPASRARLRWGAVGPLPAPSGGFKVIDCSDKYKEAKRKTDRVKVVNPDDDSQFIVFESPSAIFFNKQNKDEITISWQKSQTMYVPPGFQGPLVPVVNVVTDESKACQAEYDFLRSLPGTTNPSF